MHTLDKDIPKKGGGKRKKLKGAFSSASFRRLRTFCISHYVEGSQCWGLTLTIPGMSVVRQEYVSTWMHRITQVVNYFRIPMIWRAELQQRGQAHFHVVLYTDVVNCLRVMLHWQRQVASAGKCLSIEQVSKSSSDCVWINRAFVRGSCHMFDLQLLDGDFSSWRYLVAHQSKAKQVQQGWLGRQWGVCFRKGFINDNGFVVSDDDYVVYSVRRWVRRLTRRRISSVGRHYLLVNPLTLRRMVAYADFLKDSAF